MKQRDNRTKYERDEQIVALREKGWSFVRIAKKFNMTAAGAAMAHRKAVLRSSASINPPAARWFA
jgi:hypothetical protein